MTRYLLNTAILPNFGTYVFTSITLERAKILAKTAVSAIGHNSTAQVLTELFGFKVEKNRLTVNFEVGDEAIVFKLHKRPPEGAILDKKQLEEIGFTFGLLKRIN